MSELCEAEHCDCSWGCGDLRARDAEIERLRALVAELEGERDSMRRELESIRTAFRGIASNMQSMAAGISVPARDGKGGG